MLAKKFGIVKNKVTGEMLDEWKEVFQKNAVTKTLPGDDCWGIDKESLAYGWFLKKVMPILLECFNENMKLIFASYIDLYKKFPIHNDIKKLPAGAEGKHYLSILIPYTVNNKREDYEKVGTCFYNEDKELIECIKWNQNSILWWESDILHASSDFKAEGIKSKQFFITHTYV
jgi:hypothetical protein|tara:strand:+ start:248 stop:766 length:519 start_codon:yes stop_codon:yes gene_type:complete